MNSTTRFEGGRNIALKVPSHQFDATVRFYRDVAGLALIERHAPDVVFEFGPNQLWIDLAEGFSQAEVWLQLGTDDVAAAADELTEAGVMRRDEIEPLPAGFDGFWVSSPSDIIHLVCRREAATQDAAAAPEPRQPSTGR